MAFPFTIRALPPAARRFHLIKRTGLVLLDDEEDKHVTLGRTTVKDLVELNGDTIGVERQKGQGTVFVLWLSREA